MGSVKCMYCSSILENHEIKAQKKINGRVITVMNTPVHYCRKCNETFMSVDGIKTFNYIKQMGLSHNKLLFNFSDIAKKLGK